MSGPIYIEAQFIRAQIERLKLIHPEIAEDAELMADTLEGETDFNEIMASLARRCRDATATAFAVKDEEAALAERRQRYERRAHAARKLMQTLMETADMRKLELPVATISLVAGRKTCIVTDEAALPEQFVKTVRTPEKAKITAALAAGEDVPGAVLSNGSPHLMVRV